MIRCSIDILRKIDNICLIMLLLLCSCECSSIKVGKTYAMDDISKSFGIPSYVDTIVLKPKMSRRLYEYQNGLFKFIPDKDSVLVIEQTFQEQNRCTVLWLIKRNNGMEIIDMIDWNPNKVQF